MNKHENIMLDLNLTSWKTLLKPAEEAALMRAAARVITLFSCTVVKVTSSLLMWYHRGWAVKANSLFRFLLHAQMGFSLFSLPLSRRPSVFVHIFDGWKFLSSPPPPAQTAEIKFTWLAVFPGANRMQAARSACYFAHDSSYLSPSLDRRRPVRSGKLGKSAAAASWCRISWRTGTGLLYISPLSFSVWQEPQCWRVCLQEYIQFGSRSPQHALFWEDAAVFLPFRCFSAISCSSPVGRLASFAEVNPKEKEKFGYFTAERITEQCI